MCAQQNGGIGKTIGARGGFGVPDAKQVMGGMSNAAADHSAGPPRSNQHYAQQPPSSRTAAADHRSPWPSQTIQYSFLVIFILIRAANKKQISDPVQAAEPLRYPSNTHAPCQLYPAN